MNNVELIKALRRCSYMTVADALNEDYCKPCAYYKRGTSDVSCIERMMIDAADALEAAENRIEELEAQMPKEGEWIEDDTTYCGADRANYKCSLCGKIGGTWKRGLTQDELPNYCPNCGAKMKK